MPEVKGLSESLKVVDTLGEAVNVFDYVSQSMKDGGNWKLKAIGGLLMMREEAVTIFTLKPQEWLLEVKDYSATEKQQLIAAFDAKVKMTNPLQDAKVKAIFANIISGVDLALDALAFIQGLKKIA